MNTRFVQRVSLGAITILLASCVTVPVPVYIATMDGVEGTAKSAEATISPACYGFGSPNLGIFEPEPGVRVETVLYAGSPHNFEAYIYAQRPITLASSTARFSTDQGVVGDVLLTDGRNNDEAVDAALFYQPEILNRRAFYYRREFRKEPWAALSIDAVFDSAVDAPESLTIELPAITFENGETVEVPPVLFKRRLGVLEASLNC
ncbi:MAG: hypothetical protein AAFX52_02310 [Pseudomonadota bacterium]